MSNNKDNRPKAPGCAHCYHGWVKHHKLHPITGKPYDAANPCAYCWDNHTAPMMILRDGKIYWASRKVDKLELRDLNNLELTDYIPGWKNDHLINKEPQQ